MRGPRGARPAWRLPRSPPTITARPGDPDRRLGRRRIGPWLRWALIEAARAAGRSKGASLAAQYHRPAARRGTKRAAVAVGHTILTIAYRLLTEGDVYHDLGERSFDECDRHAAERRLVARLEGLGYEVSLDPAA
jgi:transposase